MGHSLCIDIGNTRAKIAVFGDQGMITHDFRSRLSQRYILGLLAEYDIDSAIISSTRFKNKAFVKAIKNAVPLTELSFETTVPVNNMYSTPETLGMDRIAAAVGAYTKEPGRAHLIIDAGSCMTLDVVDESGRYLGGNISPGVHMRIKAMNDHTDKLPLVDIAYHDDIIGKNTVMALQNGAVRGTIFEIEAFIDHVKSRYRGINTILTGGDAEFLANKLKTKILANPYLVLEGLYKILKHNA